MHNIYIYIIIQQQTVYLIRSIQYLYLNSFLFLFLFSLHTSQSFYTVSCRQHHILSMNWTRNQIHESTLQFEDFLCEFSTTLWTAHHFTWLLQHRRAAQLDTTISWSQIILYVYITFIELFWMTVLKYEQDLMIELILQNINWMLHRGNIYCSRSFDWS
jgi:hypothetical protein